MNRGDRLFFSRKNEVGCPCGGAGRKWRRAFLVSGRGFFSGVLLGPRRGYPPLSEGPGRFSIERPAGNRKPFLGLAGSGEVFFSVDFPGHLFVRAFFLFFPTPGWSCRVVEVAPVGWRRLSRTFPPPKAFHPCSGSFPPAVWSRASPPQRRLPSFRPKTPVRPPA